MILPAVIQTEAKEMMANRPNDKAIAEAYLWIGTPFHHQASLCGVGSDCLGLVRGIWRALYGSEPEVMPPYAPDWAEATHRETLLEAAQRNLIETNTANAKPGDVLLFRLRQNAPARHCGILVNDERMIHAWSGYAVAETPLDPTWRRRLSHAFQFPQLPPPRTPSIPD